jgi:hypothetical protein
MAHRTGLKKRNQKKKERKKERTTTMKRTRPDSITASHQPEQKQQRPSVIADLPLEIWDDIISRLGGWLHVTMVCGDFCAMYKEHHHGLGTTLDDYFELIGTIRPIDFGLLDWAVGFFAVDESAMGKFFRALVRTGVDFADFRELEAWGKLRYNARDAMCDAARYANHGLLVYLCAQHDSVVSQPGDAKRFFRSALESGDVSICRRVRGCLHDHRIESLCSEPLKVAAAVGSVPVFRWLLETGGAGGGFYGYWIAVHAAANGQLAFLRWFREQYGYISEDFRKDEEAYELIKGAIDAGETLDPDLATLKYCYALWDRRSYERGRNMLLYAVLADNRRAFRWIYEQGHIEVSFATLYRECQYHYDRAGGIEGQRRRLMQAFDEMGVDYAVPTDCI